MKKGLIISTLIIVFFGIVLFWLRLTFFDPLYDEEDVTYVTGTIENVYTKSTVAGFGNQRVSTNFVDMDNGMSFQCPGFHNDTLRSCIGEKVTVGYIRCDSTYVYSRVNKCVYFASDTTVYKSIADDKRRILEAYISLIALLLFIWLLCNLELIIYPIEKIINRREETLKAKKRAEKKKKKAELRKKYEQLNKDKEK